MTNFSKAIILMKNQKDVNTDSKQNPQKSGDPSLFSKILQDIKAKNKVNSKTSEGKKYIHKIAQIFVENKNGESKLYSSANVKDTKTIEVALKNVVKSIKSTKSTSTNLEKKLKVQNLIVNNNRKNQNLKTHIKNSKIKSENSPLKDEKKVPLLNKEDFTVDIQKGKINKNISKNKLDTHEKNKTNEKANTNLDSTHPKNNKKQIEKDEKKESNMNLHKKQKSINNYPKDAKNKTVVPTVKEKDSSQTNATLSTSKVVLKNKQKEKSLNQAAPLLKKENLKGNNNNHKEKLNNNKINLYQQIKTAQKSSINSYESQAGKAISKREEVLHINIKKENITVPDRDIISSNKQAIKKLIIKAEKKPSFENSLNENKSFSKVKLEKDVLQKNFNKNSVPHTVNNNNNLQPKIYPLSEQPLTTKKQIVIPIIAAQQKSTIEKIVPNKKITINTSKNSKLNFLKSSSNISHVSTINIGYVKEKSELKTPEVKAQPIKIQINKNNPVNSKKIVALLFNSEVNNQTNTSDNFIISSNNVEINQNYMEIPIQKNIAQNPNIVIESKPFFNQTEKKIKNYTLETRKIITKIKELTNTIEKFRTFKVETQKNNNGKIRILFSTEQRNYSKSKTVNHTLKEANLIKPNVSNIFKTETAKRAYKTLENSNQEMTYSEKPFNFNNIEKSFTARFSQVILNYESKNIENIYNKIQQMLAQTKTVEKANINLAPPELGNLDIEVRKEGNEIFIKFLVENKEAKELLDRGSYILKERLGNLGFEIKNFVIETKEEQEWYEEHREEQDNQKNNQQGQKRQKQRWVINDDELGTDE